MDALTSLPDVSGLLAVTSGAAGTAAGVLGIACLATGPGVLACEGGAGILEAISLTSGAGATAMDCNKEASGGGCIVGLVALGTVGVSPGVAGLQRAGFLADGVELSAEAVGKFLFLPFVMAAPIISIANG